MPKKRGLCRRGGERHGSGQTSGCPEGPSALLLGVLAPGRLGSGSRRWKLCLILGFLHHHHGRPAWTAAWGNLFSKTNRNGFGIELLAARMGSNCPRVCKPEPRPSVVLQKNTDQVPSSRHAGFRPGGHGTPPVLCVGTPELRSALTKVTQPVQESRACTPGLWPHPAQVPRWFVWGRRHWMFAKAYSLMR